VPAADSIPLRLPLLSSFALLLLAAGGAHADTAPRRVWHVDNSRPSGNGSYDTLAAAIAASGPGDELVLESTGKPYAGPIVLKEGQGLSAAEAKPAPTISAAEGAVITAVSGVTIRHVMIAGSGKASAIQARDVDHGTITISDATITTAGVDDAIVIHNVLNLHIERCRIRDGKGRALRVSASGSSSGELVVTDTTFSGNGGNALDVTAGDTARVTLTVRGNRFEHNAAAVAVSAAGTSRVRTVIEKNAIVSPSVSAISLFANEKADLAARIVDNTVTGAVCGGGCDGIRVVANGASSVAAAIRQNTIKQVDESAVRALAASGSATLILIIEANTIDEPHGANVGVAIYVGAGAASADTARVCAKISGNRIVGGWDASGAGAAIRLVRSARGATMALEGQRAAGSMAAAEQAVSAGNGGARVKAAMRSMPAGAFATAGTCEIPW